MTMDNQPWWILPSMIASAVIVAGAATIYAIREDKCIESPYITVNCQPKEDTSENSSSSAIAEEGSTIKDSDAEEVSNSTQQSDSVNIPDSNQQAQPIAIGSGGLCHRFGHLWPFAV